MAYMVYLYGGTKFYEKKCQKNAITSHKYMGRLAHIANRNICHSTLELHPNYYCITFCNIL